MSERERHDNYPVCVQYIILCPWNSTISVKVIHWCNYRENECASSSYPTVSATLTIDSCRCCTVWHNNIIDKIWLLIFYFNRLQAVHLLQKDTYNRGCARLVIQKKQTNYFTYYFLNIFNMGAHVHECRASTHSWAPIMEKKNYWDGGINLSTCLWWCERDGGRHNLQFPCAGALGQLGFWFFCRLSRSHPSLSFADVLAYALVLLVSTSDSISLCHKGLYAVHLVHDAQGRRYFGQV